MKKSLGIGKFITVTAAIASAALTLSACGFSNNNNSSTGASEGQTTLNMLAPSYSEATKSNWDTVISGFEKANPTVKVNLEIQSWDNLEKVISTKIQGGQTPDIYNGGPFASYATDDLLYKANEVTSSNTLSDFQEAFLKNLELNGSPYALPFIASTRALFVNNTLLKNAGVANPPKTWDELETAAKKVSSTGDDTIGYGMPLGSEEAQAEAAVWVWGGGGSFGDTSTLTIDSPKNSAGTDQIKKMIDAGVTQKDPGSTNRTPLLDIFVQGKIGMQIGLPPTVGVIKKNNPSLDYSVVPIPTKDGSAMTLGVEDQLMAFKNKGNKQEAITKFFDYFYSSEVYTKWVKAEGFLPTTKSGSDALKDDADLKPFLSTLSSAKFYPSNNPKWQTADAAFKELFGQIQSKSGTDVLASIQARVK